jgi:hypothetical protein
MHPGQGKRLPKFTQLDGEWIIENYLFLYYSDQPSKATFTRVLETTDGNLAVGFDAAQLASELGVDVTTIIEANRNHTLMFTGTRSVAPSHGGLSATAYRFMIPGHWGTLTVEIDQQEGTA